MYNSVTEENIRQIPQVGAIDIASLPQELTRIFAEIVDLRNNLNNGLLDTSTDFKKRLESLDKLASNLETFVLVSNNDQRSAAFVSATAQYLLLQIRQIMPSQTIQYSFEVNSIPSIVSSIILFMIGNSPADAAEVSNKLIPDLKTLDISERSRQLLVSIGYFAIGKLRLTLELPYINRVFGVGEEDEEAIDYLYELLVRGIQQLCALLLGDIVDKIDYFDQVLTLSTYQQNLPFGYSGESVFAGPFHLAKLFNKLQEDLLLRGVINVSPPDGVNSEEWNEVLKVIAKDRPYLWDNHYEAIQTDFLIQGTSSVLTFPTGAGKSTLAELKIASSLFAGKSIIYLVPTHALEEQVSRNLNTLFRQFPESFRYEIESDAEYTELDEIGLPPLSVMTPERCLTLLSVAPENFKDVGLVVFDEFHLVNGLDDRLEKRNVEAMFCLLQLFTEAENADFMLISAMVQNGPEIAEWVAQVISRPCISFNSEWKPTRQLQGCLVYPESEVSVLSREISEVRKTKTTKGWPTELSDKLLVDPFNFFSLKNTWDSKSSKDYYLTKPLDKKVLLSINGVGQLTSNRNNIAAEFAIYYANLGFKVLVFVNSQTVAKSTAETIGAGINYPVLSKADYLLQNNDLVSRLGTELGDISYSYINVSEKVLVHHGNLLPAERRLNEGYFKIKNGPMVMVATATLAQGINLPAEVVIMAGDDRFDDQTGKMERMQPHEILNTAGRAGRAGMAAQGIVLLIPGIPVTINDFKLSDHWWNLRQTVFSKGDQCLIINDPMSSFLDSMQNDNLPLSEEQKNILFRLKQDDLSDESTTRLFKKSFAAFRAAKASEESRFDQKLKRLVERKDEVQRDADATGWVELVSIKMATDPWVITDLGNHIDKTGLNNILSFSITEVVKWYVLWISQESRRINVLFSTSAIQDNLLSVLGFKGKDKTYENLVSNFAKIDRLILLYINGATYKAINDEIKKGKDPYLSQARKLILKIIPSLGYSFGLFSLTLREKMLADGFSVEDIPYELKVVASCVREGFDSGDKLKYKYRNLQLPRVQVHLDAVV